MDSNTSIEFASIASRYCDGGVGSSNNCKIVKYSESDPDDGLRIRSTPSSVETMELEQLTTVNKRRCQPIPASRMISVNHHPLMALQSPHNSTNRFSDDGSREDNVEAQGSPVTNHISLSPKRYVRSGRVDTESVALSSDSEPDVSQFQASVGPSFQSVSLVARQRSFSTTKSTEIYSRTRQLSLESISVRSFEELGDIECHLSRGSSTSLLEVPTGMLAATTDCPISRHQILLPDGSTREIDMKVIEPYKRVLSHGGYLKDNCQNAIVIFSSCFLPDRSRADYHYVMESLFLYVLKTLEQLVTEDYVLLYLHGGSCNNVPSFPWLKRCYQLLDRRLRKSLKNVYMVHPTFWLKSLVWMSRPFISSKFWRKLVYVKSLEELYSLVPNVERQAVPEKVKNYDVEHFKK